MKHLIVRFLIVCITYTIVVATGSVYLEQTFAATGTTLTVEANQIGAHISPTLYGLMFEDISHSGDGGLYAELIRNRIFKDDPNTSVDWSVVTSSGAQGTISLDNSHAVNNLALTTSLQLQITQVDKGQRVGVANEGYWGIPVQPETTYQVSFYARSSTDFAGPLTVDIENNDGSMVYAQTTLKTISPNWTHYTLKLQTSAQAKPSTTNRFVISAGSTGTIWFNLVSLFPPTWNTRSSGMRMDLMQKLSDMHPGFLRFPGGNYLEGNSFEDRFQWKNTLGGLEQRPGHNNSAWGYRSSDGLGLLEYLEWCEDLKMTPILAVYAGFALHGSHVPVGISQFNSLVQDALDEVQYITGDATTHWGQQRASNGHPKPFNLQYVEIGNEDFFDRSGSYEDRFAAFYDALKKAYPRIQLIATTKVKSRTPDVIDEHYYKSPEGSASQATLYDSYNRNGPKIFVGEYASQDGKPTPNLHSALGDAAIMTGIERNSDVVMGASYAPLFVNVNAPSWGTNLIGYDALNSYGSPSYYVQQLFSLYHGDVVLPTSLSGGHGQLYFVTSKASKSGIIYIKVVNTSPDTQNTQIEINGTTSINATGKAIILTSGSVKDTNSLKDPMKVVPVTNVLNSLSSSFPYSFSANSVTVLQITEDKR